MLQSRLSLTLLAITAMLTVMLLSPAGLAAGERETPAAGEETPAADEAGEEDDLEAQVRAILERPIEDADYGETQRCLSRARYRSIEVIDPQRVVFIGRGGDVWLNQLRGPCSGLDDRLALEIQARGMRLCRLDSFYGIDSSMLGIGTARRTGRCTLGDFERITPEQHDLLKEALGG